MFEDIIFFYHLFVETCTCFYHVFEGVNIMWDYISESYDLFTSLLKNFDILSSWKLHIFSIHVQNFLDNHLMLWLCNRKWVESHCTAFKDKRVVIPSGSVQRDRHLVCPELINNNAILPRTRLDRFDLPVNYLPDRSRLDDASDMLDRIGRIVH